MYQAAEMEHDSNRRDLGPSSSNLLACRPRTGGVEGSALTASLDDGSVILISSDICASCHMLGNKIGMSDGSASMIWYKSALISPS